jgi:hypothetical protein
MRPEPGQVLHFSEDPAIRRFVPHMAVTAQQAGAYVFAFWDAVTVSTLGYSGIRLKSAAARQ